MKHLEKIVALKTGFLRIFFRRFIENKQTIIDAIFILYFFQTGIPFSQWEK
jgi:hypothetical protein